MTLEEYNEGDSNVRYMLQEMARSDASKELIVRSGMSPSRGSGFGARGWLDFT